MGEENINYIKELETFLSQGNVSENIKKLLSNLTSETKSNNNINNTDNNTNNSNNLNKIIENIIGSTTSNAASNTTGHKEHEYKETDNNQSEKKETNYEPKKNSPFENADTFFKVKNIMDMVNKKDDARISLIESLRPFLSSSRQKKIPECIKILRLANIGKVFGENSNKKTGGENSER